MAAAKRNRIQIERDREEIARLYCEGRTQKAIAEIISLKFYNTPNFIGRTTIIRDLKFIRKGWLDSSIRDFDHAKSEEIAKIDHLERTYWEGWERSYGEHTKETQAIGGKHGDYSKTTTEDLAGDPRFLEGVLKCIERRCSILGLDAPDKHEVFGEMKFSLVDRLKQVEEKQDKELETRYD